MRKTLLLLTVLLTSLMTFAQPTTAPADPSPAPYGRKVGVVYSNYFGMGLADPNNSHYSSGWGNANAKWTNIEEPVITGERKVLHITGSGFAHRLTKYNDRATAVKPNEKGYTDVHVMVYPKNATTLYLFQDNNADDIQSATVTPNQWNAVTISVPNTWTENFYGIYLKKGEDLETEFWMDDFYFTNDDSYVAPAPQTLGGISLPRCIFSPTTGYNFNVKLVDTEGEDFDGDATLSWEGTSPVGAVITGTNIVFGAASGAGTYTLKATSGVTEVTANVYFVGTAPATPVAADVYVHIYTATQDATWGIEYNGGAKNNGEMVLDTQKAMDFSAAKCVFFTNKSEWDDIYNVNINPTAKKYGKLCLSIYSPIAATGKVILEGTKKITADNAFTLTAGAWKNVVIDLDGETFIKAMSVRMDKGEEILLSNIYFTEAGTSEDAGKISTLAVAPQIVAVGVATDLTLTASDAKGVEIDNANVAYTATGLASTTLTAAAAGAVTITGTTNEGAESATATVYAIAAPTRTNTGDDIEILQSGKSVTGNGTGWQGGYTALPNLVYSDATVAYHASKVKTLYLSDPGLTKENLAGYKKFHADIFSTIDIDNCDITLESLDKKATFSAKAGEWVSVDVPIDGANAATSWILIHIDGGESGAGDAEIVIDNVYFSKTAPVVPFNISDGVVTGDVTTANVTTINASTAAVINLKDANIKEAITITPTNTNAVVVVSGTGRTPATDNVTVSNGNLVVYDGTYYRAADGVVITLVDDNESQPAYNFTIDAGQDGVVYTRTVAAGAWASYNSPAPVTIPDGVDVYKATAATTSEVTFTKQDTKALGANEPVILHNTTGGAVDITTETAKLDLNLTANGAGATIKGSTVTQNGTSRYVETDGTQYALSDGDLHPFNGAKIGAFRVYFTGLTGDLARAIFDDGDVTGIKGIKNVDELLNGKFYNLQGQEVKNPAKGIYIVNGKKIILK